jgi:hypothetical protein
MRVFSYVKYLLDSMIPVRTEGLLLAKRDSFHNSVIDHLNYNYLEIIGSNVSGTAGYSVVRFPSAAKVVALVVEVNQRLQKVIEYLPSPVLITYTTPPGLATQNC